MKEHVFGMIEHASREEQTWGDYSTNVIDYDHPAGRKQDSGDEYELPCVVCNNVPPVKEAHEYEEGISAST